MGKINMVIMGIVSKDYRFNKISIKFLNNSTKIFKE